jgi:hypothetical protein
MAPQHPSVSKALLHVFNDQKRFSDEKAMKILWFLLIVSLAFFAVSASAQTAIKSLEGFDPINDVVSDQYQTGPYLIYDCVEKHWTCVVQENFQECQDKRVEDLKIIQKNLRCAPFEKLSSKKSCLQRQLYLVGQNMGTRFCLHDKWRDRELR